MNQSATAVAMPAKDLSRTHSTGLKTVLNILSRWGCSPEQMQALLQVSRSAFYKLKKDPTSARLTHDQVERLSYLLNIHASLRLIFDNPENVYGFMAMKNANPFFNGRSPLEIISTGSFGALYEVHKRIDALRSGQW